MRGRISQDEMYMRTVVGTAEKDGRDLELAISGSVPMVRDNATGRTWMLEWPAIVDLAIEELDSSQPGVIDVAKQI